MFCSRAAWRWSARQPISRRTTRGRSGFCSATATPARFCRSIPARERNFRRARLSRSRVGAGADRSRVHHGAGRGGAGSDRPMLRARRFRSRRYSARALPRLGEEGAECSATWWRKRARRGLRLIGPNCMGLINVHGRDAAHGQRGARAARNCAGTAERDLAKRQHAGHV